MVCLLTMNAFIQINYFSFSLIKKNIIQFMPLHDSRWRVKKPTSKPPRPSPGGSFPGPNPRWLFLSRLGVWLPRRHLLSEPEVSIFGQEGGVGGGVGITFDLSLCSRPQTVLVCRWRRVRGTAGAPFFNHLTKTRDRSTCLFFNESFCLDKMKHNNE